MVLTADVLRYIANLGIRRQTIPTEAGVLNQGELKRGEEVLWKAAQVEFFQMKLQFYLRPKGYPNHVTPASQNRVLSIKRAHFSTTMLWSFSNA